jgi:ABC-type transport system substrate-binding protein
MVVEEVSQERISEALTDGDFETVLADIFSGPTLLRLHMFWHSKGVRHTPGIGGPGLDSALDGVRHAASEDEYRSAVNAFQRAVVDNPPAIFLAWSERARAVSRRFTVPAVASGRDVLASIQFWRPTADPRYASSN